MNVDKLVLSSNEDQNGQISSDSDGTKINNFPKVSARFIDDEQGFTLRK